MFETCPQTNDVLAIGHKKRFGLAWAKTINLWLGYVVAVTIQSDILNFSEDVEFLLC